MTYEVLARKWRPQVFGDVIGQGHITQTLVNAINTDRMAHAYLFSGARGVGKTSVARILAKAINCIDRQDGNPCNRCSPCVEITNGSSVDVQEIDGASNRGIDEIRELRENIKYMPSSSRYRVYIIDEVHMLTLPAFNALLKTLEEPPAHVKFIFATTEPHKVPITILSRCQRFDFKRIPLKMIVEQLKKIAEEEKIEISMAGLTIIAREAEGSMRDAESLLDQTASFAGSRIDVKDISDILGIIDRDIIFEASRAIIDGSAEKCIEIVERIYNYGYDLKEFYRALMDQFRDLLVSIVAPEKELMDMTAEDMEEIRLQAEAAGKERLQQSLNVLITREEDLRFSSNPRLLLETIMIKLCSIGDLLSFEDLINKIAALEKRITTGNTTDKVVLSGNIADPGPGWNRDEKGKEETGSSSEAEEGGWDSFLRFISSKSRPMFNVLKEWDLDRIENDSLIIIRGGNSFTSRYLDETDNFDKFVLYCREFFKKDMKVKITGEAIKNNHSARPDGTATDKGPGKKSRYADLPRPVQEVMQVFQGELKDEVPAEKNRKDSQT